MVTIGPPTNGNPSQMKRQGFQPKLKKSQLFPGICMIVMKPLRSEEKNAAPPQQNSGS